MPLSPSRGISIATEKAATQIPPTSINSMGEATSTNPDGWLSSISYINSPGGSVYSGLAVYDTMRHLRAPVSTFCVGMAASMAAVLVAAGEEGKRAALPNSRIMIHQPSSGAHGTAADIEIAAKEILHVRESLNEILAFHTGQTTERIAEDVDRDRFMSPPEAVEYGIIDRVLEPGDSGREPTKPVDSDHPEPASE